MEFAQQHFLFFYFGGSKHNAIIITLQLVVRSINHIIKVILVFSAVPHCKAVTNQLVRSINQLVVRSTVRSFGGNVMCFHSIYHVSCIDPTMFVITVIK